MNSPCRWQTWSSFTSVSAMVSGSLLVGHWGAPRSGCEEPRSLPFVINAHIPHPFSFSIHTSLSLCTPYGFYMFFSRHEVTWFIIQKELWKVVLSPHCPGDLVLISGVLPSLLQHKIVFLLPLPEAPSSAAQPKLPSCLSCLTSCSGPGMSFTPPWNLPLGSTCLSILHHLWYPVSFLEPSSQGSPKYVLLHEDSALLSRLVWRGETSRRRKGLVPYGMCQGDNLPSYHR